MYNPLHEKLLDLTYPCLEFRILLKSFCIRKRNTKINCNHKNFEFDIYENLSMNVINKVLTFE